MNSLPVLNPKAAAIDVGSEQMHVSVAGGPPKVFGSTTTELHALRDYLLEQGVNTVAMEATGIYWLCPYEVLEKAGLNPIMVNGKYVRNLPGRKTDMSDCQWQATLHAHGLLRAGFVPPDHIRRLQDYLRLRADHISSCATSEQHMQKALERMNIKIHDVISDLTGVSGLKMVRAILEGERDPEKLLALCDPTIQKKKAKRVCEALRGTWKQEHLFALRQALAAWEFYRARIAECDQALEEVLKKMTEHKADPPGELPKSDRKNKSNTPQIDGLLKLLWKLCDGKDATKLPGITEHTLLRLVSEVGTDLKEHWENEKRFTSWLGLAPGTHQSGKRRRSEKRSTNKAGRLLCVIARAVGKTNDRALGGFYRRIRSRSGGLVASRALARKLGAMFWRVMVHGLAYVEHGLAKYEEKVLQTEHTTLARRARRLGLTLAPMQNPMKT